MKKVFITGMGLMSSLGHEVDKVFNRLVENGTGVQKMPEWEQYKGLNTLVAAPVGDFNSKVIPRKARRSMSRMSEMATLATMSALTQAGLPNENWWSELNQDRSLLCMGSTTGSPDCFEEYYKKFFDRGGMEGQLGTSFFKIMNHSVPSNVAVALGYEGPLISPSSACSTSSQAMILAWELMQAGLYDFVVVGGADELSHTSGGIFDIVQAASTKYNQEPDLTPRPFDKDRDGLVVSEGAGVLVLETEEHMKKRGATPLAEFLGGSYYCGGGHMSHPVKSIMEKTMCKAMERSQIEMTQVGYVNAHATATLVGDVQEAQAIGEIFGDSVPVSSMKGHFGHSLSACGAIEVICSVEMLSRQVLIPNRNLQNPDPSCAGVQLLLEPQKARPQCILSNNFAFGGMNTSLVIAQPH